MAAVVQTRPVDVNDADAVATLATGFDLVVVGPEAPLVAGMVDDLEAAGIKLDEAVASADDFDAGRLSRMVD